MVLLELVLLVLGIVVLATGKINLTRSRVVRGNNARILGVLMLLPLPVAFCIGLVVGAMYNGRPGDFQNLFWTLNAIEGGMLFAFLVIFTVACVLLAESKDGAPSTDDVPVLEEVQPAAPPPLPPRMNYPKAVAPPDRFTCPNCQQAMRFRSELAGQKVRCPTCKQIIAVPDPQVTVVEPLDEHLQSTPSPAPVPPRTIPPPFRVPQLPRMPSFRPARRDRSVGVLIGVVGAVFVVVCGGVSAALWFCTPPMNPTTQPVNVQQWANPLPQPQPPVNPWNPGPPVNGGNPWPVPVDPPPVKKPPRERPSHPVDPVKLTTFGTRPSGRTAALFQPRVPETEKETVALDGSISEVTVGGGGRYLILQLSGEKKLAVFDVTKSKIVREISLSDERVLIAAGATQLVVIYPNASQLEIRDLATGEKERVADLPASLTQDTIHQVCMGSASAGPLFAYLPKEKRTLILDLATLTTTEVNWSNWGPRNAYGPLLMRASPDGSLLVGVGGGWAGIGIATLKDGRPLGTTERGTWPPSYIVPSANGRQVFTAELILNRDLKIAKIAEQPRAFLVPAHDPGYFLALPSTGNRELPGPSFREEPLNLPAVKEVVVYTEEGRRLFSLNNIEELQKGSRLHWDKMVHYYPRAGLLVTLGSKELVLRRVDLVTQLEKVGGNYLVVASQPPVAKPGTPFTHQLDIRSKAGGVTVKKESGPEGLQVTATGQMTWAVPANFNEATVRAVLTLRDASGQDVSHTCVIDVAAP
jgi:hypothetical protein